MGTESDAPREIELKLEVEPQDLAKILAHPVLDEASHGGPARQKLHAVYFDTPDRTLQQAGISLRVRRNGERRIQTIKAADAPKVIALARSEWEHEVEGDEPDFALAEGTALERFLTCRESIQPVFSVMTERTFQTLSFGSSLIEVAADDGRVDAKERAIRFGEVELELKNGVPEDLFRLAMELSAAAPLRLSFKTKAERGFEAASGDRLTRVKASPVILKRRMASAEAFQLIGASCLRHLMANEAIVRRTPEADAVHQMRVALRRLRAAISLFKAVVEDERRDRIKAELKWMAGVLGEARDLDVYIAKVLEPARASHAGDAGFDDLLAEYQQRRSRAYAAVQEAIASPRFLNGVLEAAAWIQAGNWLLDDRKPARKRRNKPVAVAAEEELDRRWRRILKRGKNLVELDPEERHRVRIDIKKLRYATEFFESLFKGGAAKKRRRAALETLEALQEILGELNDIAVGADMDPSPAARAIHREQMSRVDDLLADAKGQYKALAALEPFWAA